MGFDGRGGWGRFFLTVVSVGWVLSVKVMTYVHALEMSHSCSQILLVQL
jgi:hypothetical protein